MSAKTFSPFDFSALQHGRRSVRDFTDREVAPDLVQAVLDDARWAPSWSNTQPYKIGVATGPLRERIRDGLLALYDTRAKPDGDFDNRLDYPGELQPRRRATGFGLYGVLGIARDDAAARDRQLRRNFEFFGAPVALFVFVHGGLRDYAVVDGGILVHSILLAAHARGLGGCALGALATWAGPVRAAFEVPAGYKLLCGVALGWPSDRPVNAYNPGRMPLADLLLSPKP